VLKGTSYTADVTSVSTTLAPALAAPTSPAGLHSVLRVPADLGVVAFVRGAIACVLEREDWPAESAGRVLLASNEALTNAIEHGSPVGGQVGVGMTVTRERADVRIVDQGVPGAAIPAPPSAPPPVTSERGRGLLIISHLADDFDVTPAGDGTEVHVGFLRAPARAEPLPVAA
jgi:anti-sigma regulatory factor (Ser/Thr protein kinase)